MPHLRTLRIGARTAGEKYRQHELDLLFYMISTIPTIRRLHTPDIPYIYTDKLNDVHDIIVDGYSLVLEETQTSPLNSRVRDLHLRFLVRTRLNPERLLNNDRYGRTLRPFAPSYNTFPL
jgi:hypothetical protein